MKANNEAIRNMLRIMSNIIVVCIVSQFVHCKQRRDWRWMIVEADYKLAKKVSKDEI